MFSSGTNDLHRRQRREEKREGEIMTVSKMFSSGTGMTNTEDRERKERQRKKCEKEDRHKRR